MCGVEVGSDSAPGCQVYENNMAVFEAVDETARTAARDNYRTFSSLVRFLVGRCSSDLDKARAIFK